MLYAGGHACRRILMLQAEQGNDRSLARCLLFFTVLGKVTFALAKVALH